MPERDWFTRETVGLCPECGAGWTGSPCSHCHYEAPVPKDAQGRPFAPSPAPRDEARETLIRALLSDVTRSHADPESADYNECDKAPCAWCEDAFRVMAAAPRADLDEAAIWEHAAKLVWDAVTGSHWTIQEPNHEWTAVNGVALHGAFRKLAAAARAPGGAE